MNTISISQIKINPSKAIAAAEDFPVAIEKRNEIEGYLLGKDLYEKLMVYIENYVDKVAIEKALRKISKIYQIAVAKKIRALSFSESQLPAEKLQGYANIYRVRVGNYRIVYRKKTDELYIILLGHRKDIYELLKQLMD